MNGIKKNILKPLDYLIVCIALFLVAFSIWQTLFNQVAGSNLIVYSLEGEWIYPLNSDTEFGVEGPLGVSHIKIQNGEALFESSPCDNQLCVLSHPISSNAHFSACLPNQVFIRVESQEKPSPQQSSDETLDTIGY